MKLEERVERLERLIQGLALELAELRSQQHDPAVNDSGRGAALPSESVKYPEPRAGIGAPPERSAGSPGNPMQGNETAPHYGPLPPSPPIDWEHLIARVWLPRIFIVVLLLGVLWGFIAAVNAGMITRPVRCWLGLAAAAFMFGAGVRQMRQRRETLGQVLLGGAHSVLVLTLFACHMLYGFLSVPLACALYGAAIVLFAGTALTYRSQSLMLAAMAAGCLLPFLIRQEDSNVMILVTYEGLFAAATLLIGWRQGFRLVYAASFLLLQPCLLAIAVRGEYRGDEGWVLGTLLLQQLLYLAIYLLEQRSSQPVAERGGLVFTSFALTAGWSYLLLVPRHEASYLILTGILAAVYSLLAYRMFSRNREASGLLAVTATLGWMLVLLKALPGEYTGAALMIEGVLALAAGLLLSVRLQQIAGAIVFGSGALYVIQAPLQEILSSQTLSWIVLLSALIAIHRLLLKSKREEWPLVARGAILWLTGVLGLVFLTELVLAAVQSMDPDSQRLILSAAWIAYALALITAGILLRYRQVRFAGILLLLLTLLKVIFVDVPGVTTAVRAILFIGLGVVGIAVSRVMHNKRTEDL